MEAAELINAVEAAGALRRRRRDHRERMEGSAQGRGEGKYPLHHDAAGAGGI